MHSLVVEKIILNHEKQKTGSAALLARDGCMTDAPNMLTHAKHGAKEHLRENRNALYLVFVSVHLTLY